KEANASVLEAYAGKSIYPNHGERVVRGCRLMQSASDIFLGWTEGKLGRHFYVRQLRDMKTKILVELFGLTEMIRFRKRLAKARKRSVVERGALRLYACPCTRPLRRARVDQRVPG